MCYVKKSGIHAFYPIEKSDKKMHVDNEEGMPRRHILKYHLAIRSPEADHNGNNLTISTEDK